MKTPTPKADWLRALREQNATREPKTKPPKKPKPTKGAKK
jgi:hypothetical protein